MHKSEETAHCIAELSKIPTIAVALVSAMVKQPQAEMKIA
jgi:hypothetical protein